jgi:hypothetical protein
MGILNGPMGSSACCCTLIVSLMLWNGIVSGGVHTLNTQCACRRGMLFLCAQIVCACLDSTITNSVIALLLIAVLG